MIIKTQMVSHWEQNARVLIDPIMKHAVIVDPGAAGDVLLNLAEPSVNQVTDIFITHCHIDHAGGVKALLELFDHKGLPRPRVAYHTEGQFLGDRIDMQSISMGLPSGQYQNVPKVDLDLKGLTSFSVGSVTGKLLYTPGHAPGHVALYFESVQSVIAGDALFRGSIGRTDLPGGDYELLIRSIKNELLTLPDETKVLSGHGPDTTIGNERRRNPFLS
ncbi:MAG: MBL fold metallo-hydrolase [Candidatus Margulisbacteria bacterium]|nr:MBL fold metallo-hydrolase [Candidatus Margulisiibacteriota bacterium]